MSTITRVVDYLFLSHPRANGMSYSQHLYRAWSLSLEMLKGGAALLIHGVVPALFQKTGTDTIDSLYQRVQQLHSDLEEPLKTD
jgi:hypothetical protein